MNEIIRSIEAQQIRSDLPQFNVGDTVRVWVKVSYGIGVERTFPINSPRVDHVDLIRRGKVRRAKLYYLRERQGKAAKIKEVKRV